MVLLKDIIFNNIINLTALTLSDENKIDSELSWMVNLLS